MKRVAVLLLLSAFYLSGCRTFGSKVRDFKIDGDAAAAQRLIVDTVLRYYPEVGGNPADKAAVDQFASGLRNGNTQQALGSDVVLQLAYKKMQSPGNPDEAREFDNYVVQEFVALTNYASYRKHTDSKLVYTGQTKQ